MADIKDTEIRFIGDKKSYDPTSSRPQTSALSPTRVGIDRPVADDGIRLKRHKPDRTWHIWLWILGIAILLLLIGVLIALFGNHYNPPRARIDADIRMTPNERIVLEKEQTEIPEGQFEELDIETNSKDFDNRLIENTSDSKESEVKVRELTINGIPIKIYIPKNCYPSLQIGKVDPKDENIILAMQAADIRKDNGKIVGACVNNGKVVSEGLAKKGYVALIDGEITVGVTDHSPMFEAAIQHNGDFFRQYPLVSDGQLIENAPKGMSVRRGICQSQNQTFIAETLTPVSFHDFSQALIDMNVNNAVYIVGSQYACGFIRKENNEIETWGEDLFPKEKNISYIVWKKK